MFAIGNSDDEFSDGEKKLFDEMAGLLRAIECQETSKIENR